MLVVEEYAVAIFIEDWQDYIDRSSSLLLVIEDGEVTSFDVRSSRSNNDDDSKLSTLDLILLIVLLAVSVSIIFGGVVCIGVCLCKLQRKTNQLTDEAPAQVIEFTAPNVDSPQSY